ncbi:TetR/AcrR family transcriptional regulator [Brevibacillus sp. DP1.3A]|uniref:TetR/AcrR family transcriptional regulator n=1 Tax=Brevibacillus sp. DP1.3A TaxID=2738867 RepID=UPI00156AE794|nr:TetR/AcrR family transcriptional regulator [Brevibacillus sp. DP1.3A]MED1918437.1 TetR/AcrR family transcriptional regulator [Bacillus thuringiensis]UED72449.1 TetR/AcrR family transcriptional regulator [Brevibacillus sp. DP1.3A]
MPRTPAENERIRQAAKDKIHAAAMTLFIKKGYHATSIDDVAKQAQISKGLLYNYYKGKEELLAAMVQIRIEEVKEVMEAATKLATPHEQLRHIVDGALDNVYQRPEVYRFYLNLQTQPEDDRVLASYREQLNEESRRQFEVQCRIFKQLGAKQPRLRSLYFSSALQGAMLMMTTYPEGFPVEEMKEQMIREYCSPPAES